MIAITAEAWLRQPTTVRRAETMDLFVSVYNGQQHFTYLDANGNLQDCWYDGPDNRWNLQQINDANGPGAAVADEYVATPQATAAGRGRLVRLRLQRPAPLRLPRRQRQHPGLLVRRHGNWNPQQINRGAGPTVPGEHVAHPRRPRGRGDLFVSVYNGQQHFTYRDANGNIQDCWYDGSRASGTRSRSTTPTGPAPTVPERARRHPTATAPAVGRPVRLRLRRPAPLRLPATPTATSRTAGTTGATGTRSRSTAAPARPWPGSTSPPTARRPPATCSSASTTASSTSPTATASGNIQDCWFDGNWNLQQINVGTGPTVAGEHVARTARPPWATCSLPVRRPAPLRLPRRQRQHPGLLVRRELAPAADQRRRPDGGRRAGDDERAGRRRGPVRDRLRQPAALHLPGRQGEHPGLLVRRKLEPAADQRRQRGRATVPGEYIATAAATAAAVE